ETPTATTRSGPQAPSHWRLRAVCRGRAPRWGSGAHIKVRGPPPPDGDPPLRIPPRYPVTLSSKVTIHYGTRDDPERGTDSASPRGPPPPPGGRSALPIRRLDPCRRPPRRVAWAHALPRPARRAASRLRVRRVPR